MSVQLDSRELIKFFAELCDIDLNKTPINGMSIKLKVGEPPHINIDGFLSAEKHLEKFKEGS